MQSVLADQHPQFPSQYQLPLNCNSSEEIEDSCNLFSLGLYITSSISAADRISGWRVFLQTGRGFLREIWPLWVTVGSAITLSHQLQQTARWNILTFLDMKENITIKQGLGMWPLCHNSEQKYCETSRWKTLQGCKTNLRHTIWKFWSCLVYSVVGLGSHRAIH